MIFTKLRQNQQVQSTEAVEEGLVVTDGYFAGQNADGYSIQDDINYLRTAIKNLKGVDSTGSTAQQHFSSNHSSITITGDGYGLVKGLPVIETVSPNSINHALWLLTDKVGGGGSVGIGAAEDGYYTDGLFVDFVPATAVGTAVDRFNEVLKDLVPPAAPALTHVDYDTTLGVAGYSSFGASNTIATYSNIAATAGASALDRNGTISTGTVRKGIYVAAVSKTGTLADTTAAHLYSYPANSFGSGDLGTLQLELNGVVVHSVTLSSFGSGTSLNGNGSGFTLSAATSVVFTNLAPFTMFKYRTGSWTVGAADQRNGWNYMRVLHTGITPLPAPTNYFDWIVDAATTATSFSGESLHDLSLTGSTYISGVRYYTGGTEQYDLTVNNLYRNTFSTSASAISHPVNTNCTIASAALSPTISTEADSLVIVNKVATIAPDTNSRILNAGLTVNTLIDRTVQSDLTSSGVSDGYRILLDANTAAATNTSEDFKGEVYRQMSTLSITDTTYSSGGVGPAAYEWDSTQSLTSGSAGHDTGLLVYNDKLVYPTQGLLSGDFRNVADGNASGPTTVGGYSGNPNYSAASGSRTYLRHFYVGNAKQNFTFNFTVTGTSFVSVATGASGNNLTAEILAPNTTTSDGGTTIVWKDMVTAYTTDNSVGAFAASYGATIPTSWGVSLGTKSTATSGSVVVLRLTAASGWTGSVDNITITVL